MKVLINPEPFLSPPNSIFPNKPPCITRFQLRPFPNLHRHRSINRRLSSTPPPRATLDSTTIEQFGIPEFDVRNPALSSSYRSSALPRPNQTVLEAQARVCTGPTQTRPLDEQQAFKVFDTILRSGYSFFHVTLMCYWWWFGFYFSKVRAETENNTLSKSYCLIRK